MSDRRPLYQVVNWNDHFENNKSRERKRCGYVTKPNKHGGGGWLAIAQQYNGHGLHGIWTFILEMCSRHPAPREGYLTADGTRDGWRLGSDELAHMFHCPAADVRRLLAIASSPRVGWLRLVDGIHETPAEALSVPAETGTDSARESGHSECPESGHRKNEGKNEGNSLSPAHARGEEDDEEDEELGAELDRMLPSIPVAAEPPAPLVPAETGTDSARESGHSEDVITHAEAKTLLSQLSLDVFGKKLPAGQWSYKMDHELSEVLPFPRENWELIDWFYRLCDDRTSSSYHAIFEITAKRQSIEALIENLGREVQKIRSARKKLGLNGLHTDDQPEKTTTEWTPERRAAWEKMFPGTDPGPFHLLDREMRERIEGER